LDVLPVGLPAGLGQEDRGQIAFARMEILGKKRSEVRIANDE
jgi:hypothetical protein